MLKIGLTGGIGAGKSAVAARLAEHGAVIIDSDVLAREVVAPGTEGLREIEAAFGGGVLAPDDTLDRPALGARIFGDDAARRRLEAIIHPRVRTRTDELAAAAPPDAIIVNDVPLLVEAGLAPRYHLVIVVDAPERVRVERLVRTRGMSAAEARARMAAQATDGQRRAAADVLLPNDGSLAALHGRVDALWERLRRYDDNLRAGRPANPAQRDIAPGEDVVNGGSRDGEARDAARSARLAARIRHAAGDLVDHIAPAGTGYLPQADVLRVDLTVARPEDAARLAPLLAAAGFAPAPAPPPTDPHQPGPQQPQAGPPPTGSPPAGSAAGPAERWFGSADPGEPAQIRVRVSGAPPSTG